MWKLLYLVRDGALLECSCFEAWLEKIISRRGCILAFCVRMSRSISSFWMEAQMSSFCSNCTHFFIIFKLLLSSFAINALQFALTLPTSSAFRLAALTPFPRNLVLLYHLHRLVLVEFVVYNWLRRDFTIFVWRLKVHVWLFLHELLLPSH